MVILRLCKTSVQCMCLGRLKIVEIIPAVRTYLWKYETRRFIQFSMTKKYIV